MISSRAIKQNDTVCIINHFHNRWRQPCYLMNAFRGLSQHLSNTNFASTTFCFFGIIWGKPHTHLGNWLIRCWAVGNLPWSCCHRNEDKESTELNNPRQKAAGGMVQLARGLGGHRRTPAQSLSLSLKEEHLLIWWGIGFWVTSKITEPTFWLSWSPHHCSPILWEKTS